VPAAERAAAGVVVDSTEALIHPLLHAAHAAFEEVIGNRY
jgi:hypothetical protein